jgi:peptidoglycan/LPS O-acetylase OafA/YrhL
MVLAGFLLPQSSLIFRSLPTFSLGWLLAHRFLRPHPVQVLGLVICLLSTAFWAGLLQAIVTLFFAALLWLALRWPRLFPSPLLAVGSISYSLYLLHVPIGGRVVNLATRFNPTPVQWLFVAVLATLLSLFASWIFYRLVEAPIHRFSRRLRPSLLIGR